MGVVVRRAWMRGRIPGSGLVSAARGGSAVVVVALVVRLALGPGRRVRGWEEAAWLRRRRSSMWWWMAASARRRPLRRVVRAIARMLVRRCR